MLMKKLFTLFSLLLFSIGGMLAANISNGTVIYFDATAYSEIQTSIASGKTLQMLLGHSSWSQGYKMSAVEGYDNIYSVTMPKWDGCTQLAFCTVDSEWEGEQSSVTHRLNYVYKKTEAHNISGNLSGNVGFAGVPLVRTNNYTLPVKTPVISIGAAPEFATTTVGETTAATVKYTVENSEEKPEISLDNDAFKAEDAEGTITITFAPTEAKEYTATLTLTIGEVEASIELAATAKEADAPAVPEIINLVAGEIAEIYVGETTEFEITYELANAEEATASIEGEGFTIKKQEVGTATIEFAPTEAKTYEAVVTITSGETIKTLEISATAKKVPVVITISFVNPDWETANLYAWGAEGLPNSWPGEAMTKGENSKFTYDLTIPEDGAYQFIINNGAEQSVDVAGVTESTCYILGTKVDSKYELIVSENCEYAPAPEPEPIDPYVALRGSMTDWTMANDIKLTYNAEAENGPEWYILEYAIAEGDEFKVVSVDEKSVATWYGSDKVDLQGGLTNAGEGDGNIILEAGTYDIYYKVNEGRIWIQKFEIPSPDPALIVSAEEVVFEELELGEEPVSATETITYEVKNSDETVVIALESDVFTAEDVDGTITITFAPEAEGEYTAELTLTLGEIVKTVAISGSAKAAAVDPEPALEFALVGRLNGDNDTEILDYESGYKFTQVSEFVYTVNVTFSGTVEGKEGEQVQKVKLVDSEGNIWARNSSKQIDTDGTATMTKGETGSSAYLITEADVEYKITYTLVSDEAESLYKLSGQLTFEKVETVDPIPDPDPEPEPEPEPDPEYPKTITVKVACAWEVCNIWAWYADESGNVYTEWPGEAMTKGEDGFYSIDMTIASPVYIKVNAGQGKTESDNYMTELSESTCFNMDGLALVVNADCEYEEPIEIEPYYGIRGLVSWEMADDIKLTEDADKAEWYITGLEVDGTQEFKVVYIDETGAATWFGYEVAELQEGVVNNGTDNIILAAGKYDIYFKANDGMMWIQFSADTPTDVEDAAAELIYAVDGTIIAPAPFAIIDLSGKDVTNANGSLQGTYIVKTLNSVTKISVQ